MKREKPLTTPRMTRPAKRLQFAVRFATLDLDTLRPGDWLNLRDDFQAFLDGPLFKRHLAKDLPLHGGDVIVRAMDGDDVYDYTPEAFRALQTETYAVLSDMVIGPREGSTGFHPIDIHVRMCAPALDGLVEKPGHHALIVEGTLRDTFLWLLLYLLAQGATEDIARCPECGGLFYRIKKQVYCSRTCNTRVTVRRWREKQRPMTKLIYHEPAEE